MKIAMLWTPSSFTEQLRWPTPLANSPGQPLGIQGSRESTLEKRSDTLFNFTEQLPWPVALANSAGQLP